MGNSTSGDAGGDSATAGSTGVLSSVVFLNVFLDGEAGSSFPTAVVRDAGGDAHLLVGHLEFNLSCSFLRSCDG